jgi:hypothetical protein
VSGAPWANCSAASERSFSQARLLISVLVQYLNANDAGPGFYDLARESASCGPARPRTRS